MAELVKETIIIVHGTWAAPEPGTKRWYQPCDDAPASEQFIAKLDSALQKRGSPARCWAHCIQGSQIFHWSGENSWIARTRAAAELADYVAKLRTEGWRCHIVAHSHGGNVVVEALPRIMTASKSGEPPGTIVTLGTPFIDTKAPIAKRSKRVGTIVGAVMVGAFSLVVIPLALLIIFRELLPGVFEQGIAAYFSDSQNVAMVLVLLMSVGSLLLLALPFLVKIRLGHTGINGESAGTQPQLLASAPWEQPGHILTNWLKSFLYKWTKAGHAAHPSGHAAGIQPKFLAIGSRKDETWQILYHLRTIDNPLAVGTTLNSYLLSSVRLRMSRAAEAELILGAKPFSDLGIVAKWWWTALYFVCVLSLLAWVPATLVEFRGRWLSAAGFVVLPFLGLYLLVLAHREFAGLFYSASTAPIRWYGRLIAALASVPTDVVTYFVRRQGWRVLVAMAMGLEGYRFELPNIEQRPSYDFDHHPAYEDLPTGAVQRALAKRNTWIGGHFGDVSETFSKMAVTAADITSLLRAVEADQSLVHAAYYTDDECIDRIADWIAAEHDLRALHATGSV